MVYERGWEATVEELLIRCIKSELEFFTNDNGRVFKTKLISIADNNVFSWYKK